MSMRYDLAVIGAGAGGLVGATFAARLGARVALVERDREAMVREGGGPWTSSV